MGIILTILIFGIIIFVHELGHFLVAKWNKIRVYEFSMGMGPRLFSFVKGETRYSLKLLPIGGSCMMGEDDANDNSEGSFNSKSVWARMAVVVAGAVFNFLLALIFAAIVVGYTGYDEPKISGVIDGFPAQEAGLQAGDKIVSINDDSIHIWREVQAHNTFHPGEKMEIEYERDGKVYKTTIEPMQDESGQYLIGITRVPQTTDANLFTAIEYGAYEVKFMINTTIESLKMLITGAVGMDQLSGPVGIVSAGNQMYEETEKYGFSASVIQMLSLGVLLSANLGVMNLLPLPALDGGRMIFLIIEAIRRKRIPPEKEGWVHGIGMLLLLALMAFVLFNDVIKLF